jgi:tRNA(adenine34) deaminase
MVLNFNEIDHVSFMKEAIKEAEKAGKRGDKPIGAVIVHRGRIIARGSNQNKTRKSDVAHAENGAIYSCESYLQTYGRECVLYTTVEPCVMCLATIVLANIRNIVFAVEDNYMKTKMIIDSSPYIKARIHNYVSGVLEEASLNTLRKYMDEDLALILKGVR